MKNNIISNCENFEIKSETNLSISELHKISLKFTFNSSLFKILNHIAELFLQKTFKQIPESVFEKPKNELIEYLKQPIKNIYKFDADFLSNTDSLFSEFYDINIIKYATFIKYAKLLNLNKKDKAYQLFNILCESLKMENKFNLITFDDFINNHYNENTKYALKSINLFDFIGDENQNENENNKNFNTSISTLNYQILPQTKSKVNNLNIINENSNIQINSSDDNINIFNNISKDNYDVKKQNDLYDENIEPIIAQISTNDSDVINNINNNIYNCKKKNEYLQKKRKKEKKEKPFFIPYNNIETFESNPDKYDDEINYWLEINEENFNK